MGRQAQSNYLYNVPAKGRGTHPLHPPAESTYRSPGKPMNRLLLLLIVLVMVFGLKACTPDDCKPLYNITQPCWTVEYFIDG
jgi:hypothetical protein